MVIVLKNTASQQQVEELISRLERSSVRTNLVQGVHSNIIGLIGDTVHIDIEAILANECVESVQRVQEPYKNANRKFHPDNTVLDICSRQIGGSKTQVIAGPCSVESEKQLMETAIACKQAGATMLRGGAFKPRTSPYSFQGLREEGIALLLKAKKETGLPIVTEIMSLAHIDMFTGRRKEYAELRAAQSTRALRQADTAKARSFKHSRGASDERGVYNERGQLQGDTLRKRYTHL